MKKLSIAFAALLLLLASCSRTNYFDILSKREIKKFSFTPGLNDLITYEIEAVPGADNNYTAVFPNGITISNLTPSFEIDGYALFAGGKRQKSGVDEQDFTDKEAVEYILYSYDGKSTAYTVTVKNAEAYFDSYFFSGSVNPALAATVTNADGSSDVNCRQNANSYWFDIPHCVALNGLVPSWNISTESSGGSKSRAESETNVKLVKSDGKTEGPCKSGVEQFNFESPKIFRVTASDGSYLDYHISPLRLKKFTFKGYEKYLPDGAPIDDNAFTIELPYGTSTARLTPVYEIMGEKISFRKNSDEIDSVESDLDSGKDSYDFSGGVTITVSAATGDGASISKIYLLTVKTCEKPGDTPVNEVPVPVKPDGTSASDVQTYSVTYDLNGAGGSSPVDSGSYYWGKKFTLLSVSLQSSSGWYFTGWNTNADGSGVAYSAGQIARMPGHNLKLYAQWDTKLTVTYDGNGSSGGSSPVDSGIYQVGSSLTILGASTLTRTGYSFAGWNTSADGSGTSYTAGSVITMPSTNLILYTMWNKIRVSSVVISNHSLNLLVGSSETLTATVSPAEALGTSVTWSSSNSSVASVDQSGLVSVHSCGSAQITVTTVDGGLTANCAVTASLEMVNGSTTTYRIVAEGNEFNVISTPDLPTSATFPMGVSDSDYEDIPSPFMIADSETTYALWKEVYDWATTEPVVGSGKRADGGDLYFFQNTGNMGAYADYYDTHPPAPTLTPNCPVVTMNWRDMIVWCNALTEYHNANNGGSIDLDCVYSYGGSIIRSSKDANSTACDGAVQSSSAKGFRLLTTIEWEFAARFIGTIAPGFTATTTTISGITYYWTPGNFASGASTSTNYIATTIPVAWCTESSTLYTHAVKTKLPNTLGIYDLSGNVWELCSEVSQERGGAWNQPIGTGSYLQVGRVKTDLSTSIADGSLGMRFGRSK